MISTAIIKTDQGTSSPYLGVEQSVEGKRWVLRDYDEREALMLVQRFGLPDVVGRALVGRGISGDSLETFLSPTLRELLPDPSRVKDMDLAAERVAAAIINDEGVGVFGDYDVDGATSSALLFKFIQSAGGRCRIYIPDRLREGYGPNGPALLNLARSGASLIITVDCGVSAHEALSIAKNAGIDVVVVDHHAAESDLPPAMAVVNPNRLDDDSGLGHLAAVGVAFLLVVAINRELRRGGWYVDRAEPDLMDWLDLVALGTVCDVVPLRGLNRALVIQGLKVLQRRRNPGLRALADVAAITESPTAYHLGFVFGPRVNAGGRVGAADLGARLLTTTTESEIKDLAQRLDALNRERQSIEALVLEEAMVQLAKEPPAGIVMAVGSNWHPGVIGIVASRLKERFNRPAFVISVDTNSGLGKGSGRSITGIDLGACIIAARQAGLLEHGGGHRMAAGFSISSKHLKSFREFIEERVFITAAEANIVPTLYLDGAVTTAGANFELIETLERLAPFGSGNAEPRFVIPSARVTFAEVVGKDHVRCTLQTSLDASLKGICFRSLDRPLGQLLLKSQEQPLHVAGRLRVNNWQGRSSPQLLVDDVAQLW